MVNVTRREVLKTAVSLPLLPIIPLWEKKYFAYKVVKYINEKYFSYIIYNQFSKEYKINEWTYPDVGKLFVFEAMKNVRMFDIHEMRFSQCKIYLCEVKNPIPSKKDIINLLDRDDIKSYWDNNENNIKSILKPAPFGTILCDAIKLLEEREIKA